jgi:hypothetical protein
MKLTIKKAEEITGGIGKTSKTGLSYGIPAVGSCNVGAKLTEVKGSVCESCYGCKGTYGYPVVRAAQSRRFESVKLLGMPLARTRWVNAMVLQIEGKNKSLKSSLKGYFRWHDTGDIISVSHLQAIAEVAKELPDIKFWLPTKEYQIVKDYLECGYTIPKNLCVRLSSYMVDQKANINSAKLKRLPVSHVHTEKAIGHKCGAVEAHSGCAEIGCRKCWDKKVKSISYGKH